MPFSSRTFLIWLSKSRQRLLFYHYQMTKPTGPRVERFILEGFLEVLHTLRSKTRVTTDSSDKLVASSGLRNLVSTLVQPASVVIPVSV